MQNAISKPLNTQTNQALSKTLHRTQKEFKAIFDQSNDGIIIVREGKFTDCNNRICEMFGYSKEEFVNNTPADLSPEYQPSVEILPSLKDWDSASQVVGRINPPLTPPPHRSIPQPVSFCAIENKF